VQSISSDFEGLLGSGHTYDLELTILGNRIEVPAADVVDGEVVADATAAVRRSFNATIVDRDRLITPTRPSDELLPYGTEVTLRWGMVIPGGATEWVSLGVFRLTSVRAEDNANGGRVVVLEGFDRSHAVTRPFVAPYAPSAGGNYAQAIAEVISARYAPATFNFATTTFLAPPLTIGTDTDPWQFCLDAAASIGLDLFVDRAGVFTLRPPPSRRDALAWTFIEGQGGITLDVARTWTEENTFNGVIVTSSNSGSAGVVRAEAWDEDPASPTYRYGRFGENPKPIASPYVTNDAQGQALAELELRRLLRRADSLEFTCVPNPALDPDDLVRVMRNSLTLDERYLLERLTFPLTPETEMSGTAARQ
jgi:hypothetical protein